MVSVVIPTHNRWDLTEITLRNVLLSEQVEFEVIVVDDGSSDGTADQIASIKDPRLQVHRFTEPRGASAARNHGFDNSLGDYVCLLDSDDLVHPQKLALQVAILQEHPLADLTVCQMAHFETDPNRAELLWNTFSKGNIRERYLQHDAVWGIHAPLWRRTALERVAASRPQEMVLDDSLPMGQDYELHARAVCLGLQPIISADLLCYCRRHTGPQISTSRSVRRIETLISVFRSLEPFLTADERVHLEGNYQWLANLASIQAPGDVMAKALGQCHNSTLLFKVLCRLCLLTRRHRFFAMAREEAKRHGHDFEVREKWYHRHRIDDEPDLKRFEMPAGSF